MAQYCRTCLQQVTARVFGMAEKLPIAAEPSIKEALELCVPELDLDALPCSKICCSCYIALCSAYKFRSKCVQSALIVSDYLNIPDRSAMALDIGDLITSWTDTNLEEKVASEDIIPVIYIKNELKPEVKHPMVVAPVTKPRVMNELVYRCNRCKNTFSNNSHLRWHVRTMHKPPPTKDSLKCEHCPFIASTNTLLRQHHKRRHIDKKFVCDVCGYRATQGYALNQHMRVHSDVKPYECPHCEFRAKSSSTLSTHLRLHTGEKPFVCDRCGYATAVSTALKVHMRTHTGIRPYKCDVCSFSATIKGHLVTHKRTHTGERPYSCGICGYCARVRGNLKQHLRTHNIGEI